MRSLISPRVGVVLFLSLLFARSVSAQIDPILAQKYFKEAEAISNNDGARLWNITLYGPMLFADPQSRTIIANLPDKEGKLTKQNGVYFGKLPNEFSIANMAFNWAGMRWTMVIWPPPEDPTIRGNLMIHELFHSVQADLGFPLSNPDCNHLDQAEGRTWMQMEWRALEKALQSKENRLEAIEDAILFRKQRRELFSGASASDAAASDAAASDAGENERLLEMNEGLAEYTGVRLSGGVSAAMKLLKEGPTRKSFVRSFAYVTGPAYGLLLDEMLPDWRKNLKATDTFDVLLWKAISKREHSSGDVMQRAASYGLKDLQDQEAERERLRQRKITQYTKKFTEDPRLLIPLKEMQVQFDPNELQPLEPFGTVYPQLRISDVWGVLTATEGALINSSWKEVIVSAPLNVQEKSLKGQGWTIDLNSGWIVKQDPNGKDFRLTESSGD